MTVDVAEEKARLRIALFSGILGSLGATVGWLAWIAIQAIMRDWKVLLAPVIGVLLGYAIQWIERYIHTAKHEREHADGQDHPQPAESRPTNAGSQIRIWALALGFLALACEHLVGHLMSEFLMPFLASLATLFPAGAVFGFALTGGRNEKSVGGILLLGALAGLIAAAAAFVVWLVMGAGVRWDALLGWWVLVGLGLFICCPNDRTPNPFHTTLGVLVSLLIVVICSIPGLIAVLEKAPVYISWPTMAVASAVDASMRSPDVPATFWMQAEKRVEAQESAEHASPPPPPPQDNGATTGDSYGSTGNPDDRTTRPWGTTGDSGTSATAGATGTTGSIGIATGSTSGWSGMSNDDLEKIRRENEEIQRITQEQLDKNTYGGLPDLIKDESEARRQQLMSELHKGIASGLLRSWIVLLLFAFGIGVAPPVERILRPLDYPNSRTLRNDRLLGATIAALILISCLVVRANLG